VIVEYDKLDALLEAQGSASATRRWSLAGGDFEFDVTDEDTAPSKHRRWCPRWKTRRWCASCRRC
jgi:hypothetical protein